MHSSRLNHFVVSYIHCQKTEVSLDQKDKMARSFVNKNTGSAVMWTVAE
jgi:hypothetical protein